LRLGPERSRNSLARWLKHALGSLALACYRHGFITLAIAAVVGGVSALGASRLTLDPDIAELLPPTRESVQNVEALRKRFGGIGNVVLLVRGGTAEARRTFADRVAPELERLGSVSYVEARRPRQFFEDRALLFLDQRDLEQVRDRLDTRRRYEVERAQLDLDDAEPPSVDMRDLRDKYRQKLGGATGSVTESTDYYEDANELAIFVRPTELASNLTFSKRVVRDVEGVLERVKPASVAPGLHVELSGRYKKRVDLQAVLGKDLAFTGSLALFLVIGYVAFHFRRVLAVMLVMAPLLFGLELTYGVAGFGFGTLNILTAFVGAILLGIGIDNGIHMLGRFEEARLGGASLEQAVYEAFADAGRVSVAAALTTASAFGCLALSDFRAFHEFGVLAAAGMLIVLFSYLTLLPAGLGLVMRYAPRLGTGRASSGLPGVPRLMRAAPLLVLLLGTLFLALSARAPYVRFDTDFASLDRAELPSFQVEADVNRLLGRSQTPLVFLAKSEADARATAHDLRERMKALGTKATVGEVAALTDLVPADQAEKMPVLARIASTLSFLKPEGLPPDQRADLERLRRMASATPFTQGDLPPALLKPFTPRDGSGPAHFVLAYPRVSMSDGGAVRELARQLGNVQGAGGTHITAAGEPMLMADILEIVEHDAPRIVALTLALVLLTLRLTAGSWRIALLSALPALLTFTVTAGVLSLLRIDLNYLNMVMLPIFLGIGVDDGMHIVTRVAEGDPIETVWTHTGWNIFGAILTDVFGFGVLALAAHPGLASLGKVALVGLTVNLVACVLLLPALLAVRRMLPPGLLRRPAPSSS
jgi:predicted RND superfamily exporter protein